MQYYYRVFLSIRKQCISKLLCTDVNHLLNFAKGSNFILRLSIHYAPSYGPPVARLDKLKYHHQISIRNHKTVKSLHGNLSLDLKLITIHQSGFAVTKPILSSLKTSNIQHLEMVFNGFFRLQKPV